MPARRAFLLAAAALLLPRLAAPAPQRSVAVAVAANMKPAFEELAARFQATHPGVEVKATYGASGNFFAQIANGAPFDLFLSADAEFPARVVEKGLADGKAFTYAYGKLVVWVPKSSKIDLDGKGLAALTDPSVQKIAIASPEVAPYGRAAKAALEKAGLYQTLKDRIVTGQSVSQTAQFVQSGNAQAGFVPLSLARTPPLSEQGRAWPVPPSSYARIEQAGVVVKGAKEAALARELAAFIAGAGARDVLERYGYDLPAR
ncbi:MAG TPA: molybdate ABC transporter substrate-binding protein [Anaeromyxobacter sp.]|jgi:molybdate transport system substrate-binding protein|nr:molybdate ABC transporter substrate-binding protein [Anaeromyxobacter sp.]